MKTILLTGVTGLVGSSIAPLLRQNGYRLIYLVRPNKGQNAADRLKKALGEVSPEDIAIEGDITLPYGGMSAGLRRNWMGQIEKIVHCAASIRFDESLSEETCFTNLQGARNMLKLATDLRVPEFHFLSTAYVAGDAENFNECDFEIGQVPRNAYESSKQQAEGLVRSWPGGRFSIYRPSIIVGDADTGFTSAFDGYYGCFKVFWFLRNLLEKRFEQDPEKCKEQGIDFDANGILHLPLNIPCSAESTLNFVTRDWLSRTLVDLIGLRSSNRTYHLVHPNPPKVRWVSETSLRLLGMTGFRYYDPADLSQWPLLKRIQKSLDGELKRYLPYINHGTNFGSANLVRALGEKYSPPVAITEELLARILNFAKSVNFGRGE